VDLLERTYGRPSGAVVEELLISSDSHVIEPEGLWKKQLPKAFQDRAPDLGGRRKTDHPGAMDKTLRLKEMAADGVSAEVLYPTHGLRVLSLDEPALEEACARVYNDWLIDYCQAAPDRLIGLAILSVYNIEGAVREMERCRKAGLRGCVIWQVPAPALPFTSEHYEPLWAAAEDLDMPVNLHILTGHGEGKASAPLQSSAPARDPAMIGDRRSVNQRLSQVMDSLYDIIYAGVLECFPRLKLVLVETEIGWIPFVLEQWDYYYKRHGSERHGLRLKHPPSEYFHRQVYATFFNDAVGGHLLSWWGGDNCMWSNDYPHVNSTWPRSREIVARDMGALRAETRAKLLRENVARLYNMSVPDLAATPLDSPISS